MIRNEVHTRCAFADAEYGKLVAKIKQAPINAKIYISGLNAYKLDQAFRIWCHYRNEMLNTLDVVSPPVRKRHRPKLKLK